MSVLKSDFVALADELINGEFADFKQPCVFVYSSSFDYATQSNIEVSQSVECIRTELDKKQYQSDFLQAGDIMLIAEKKLFNSPVAVDSTTVTVGGEKHQIKSVEIDPADAAIIMQCRKL